MSKIRRIDFSPDEFLAGVSDLKHDEIGPYWIACTLMYSRGGPIPDDAPWIARACGCHWRTWERIRARLLAIGKLRLTPEGLTNDRVERELIRAQGRVKSAADAAEESARVRALRNNPDPLKNGARVPHDGRKSAAGTSQEARTTVAGSPQDEGVSAKINDLTQATAQNPDELTTNYQLPTNNEQRIEAAASSTVAPREAQPEDLALLDWQRIAAAEGWPPADFLNSTRRYRLQAILAICGGIEGWRTALELARDAEYLRTKAGKPQGWFDLDWMLKDQNFTRLMEGRYAERHAASDKPTTGDTLETLARLSREDFG